MLDELCVTLSSINFAIKRDGAYDDHAEEAETHQGSLENQLEIPHAALFSLKRIRE